MKRLLIVAVALVALAALGSIAAPPAEARCGWYPGKLLGRAVANGVERRRSRRADGRGLARVLPRNWGR